MDRMSRVGIKPVERPAPAGEAMNRDIAVELSTLTVLSSERNDIDAMTPADKLVGEHLDVQVPPPHHGRWVTVIGQHDAHQVLTSLS
jgi:hypothetical protein